MGPADAMESPTPPAAWDPPDLRQSPGLPSSCTLCAAPLYRWCITLDDLWTLPDMDLFWDIVWLCVGQTWGPTWHPMQPGYANTGPCVRREERTDRIREAAPTETPPLFPPSSVPASTASERPSRSPCGK